MRSVEASSTSRDANPNTERRATSAGPSQVATESYRKGWDAIWGRKRIAGDRAN